MSFLSKLFNPRSHELRAFADQHDMYFLEKDMSGTIDLLHNFDLFAKGNGQRIRNVLSKYEKLVDTQIHLFDYSYKNSSGERKTQTVFYVKSSKLELPRFTMEPKGFFRKVKDLLIVDNVGFENYPGFNAKYIVQGRDKFDIEYTFKRSMLEFFSIEKNWSLEGMNDYLIFYQYHKVVEVEHLKTLFDKGRQLCDNIINDESNEFV